MTEPSTFPPVAELVPHEPPMLLVDELIAWTPARAQVRATIRAGSPFVVDGVVSAAALVEYVAQAVAVAEGMAKRHRGDTGASAGLLLGSRELRFAVEAVTVGEVLDIFVERRFADDRLAAYACEARRGQAIVVEGVLNVMSTTIDEVQA